MNHIHTIGLSHRTTVYVNAMMIIAVHGCPATASGKTALLQTVQAFSNARLAEATDEAEGEATAERESVWRILSSVASATAWIASKEY